MTDKLRLPLESKNTENTKIRFLPENATELLQPSVSFVNQKIKIFCLRIECYRLAALGNNLYFEEMPVIGMLSNPVKYLMLSRNSIRDAVRDKPDLTYTRKAIIRCGFSKQMNGQ